jgi:hypothetical protein
MVTSGFAIRKPVLAHPEKTSTNIITHTSKKIFFDIKPDSIFYSSKVFTLFYPISFVLQIVFFNIISKTMAYNVNR